ncbi:MAG TPA: U32 family peptidase [Polyangia bacterium]
MKLLETGIRLSLPYNHDPGYPEWLDGHVAGVAEVYFPLHWSVSLSARTWAGPADPAGYEAQLGELAAVLNRAGLTGNVTLNLMVFERQYLEIERTLGRLAERFDHLAVTLADFAFARRLHRDLPALTLGVSTMAQVDSTERARCWRDDAGVSAVVLARHINKRLDHIRSIRALGLRIKMVLDDLCLPDCPAFMWHVGWLMDVKDRRVTSHPCPMQAARTHEAWKIAQKDVVPAILPRYDGLVDIGKLEGREAELEAIDRRRRLYLEAESWDHPNHAYREPPEAFDRICACDRECLPCGWCPAHFQPVP